MGALEKAKSLVASHPAAVFSKSYCPYCIQVKQLLRSLGAKIKVLELDAEEDGADIQDALSSWTKKRTVPQVFVGGKFIGGCDDTVALHGQGKLVPLLQAAGAV